MERRTDLTFLFILALAFVFLYSPIWTSTYLYTDEAVQIWFYGKVDGFRMFSSQGRTITERLFLWLFGAVQRIDEIKYVRLFSFFGWLVSIPAWYYTLKRVLVKEGLPPAMSFFFCLYLLCMPSMSISVLWASCLEVFLANTTGLLSGYFLYSGIRSKAERTTFSLLPVTLSVIFGLISLFTYQNGFGCFFLPFVIHAISPNRTIKRLWIGMAAYLVICLVYFVLFKLSMPWEGVVASERTGLHIAPWKKIRFFLLRPMSSAFHYTWLFNELNLLGYILYAVLFGAWILFFWWQNKGYTVKARLLSLATIMMLLGLSYLPSLLVRENYSSNRTLLAVKMAVMILTVVVLFYHFQKVKLRRLLVFAVSVLFLANAWYNIHYLFLKPVSGEYTRLRAFVERHYHPGIHTVYFIRPEEDFFMRQHGIQRSWDEYGVPSSFFDWTPEFFVRQVVLEKTGNRKQAETIVVQSWPGKEGFKTSGVKQGPGILLIPAEEVLAGKEH